MRGASGRTRARDSYRHADHIYPDVGIRGISVAVGTGQFVFFRLFNLAFFHHFLLLNHAAAAVSAVVPPFFPGGANVTGNIAVTLVLALFTFFTVNIFGNKHYWKDILWPDVPTWLKVPVPLMPAIEIIGMFTKPFSLLVRLFANILAGHFMILGVVAVIFLTAKMGAAVNGGLSAVAVILGVFMDCLELLVAFIQAYVFTMLSAVCIGLSRQKAETD